MPGRFSPASNGPLDGGACELAKEFACASWWIRLWVKQADRQCGRGQQDGLSLNWASGRECCVYPPSVAIPGPPGMSNCIVATTWSFDHC